MSYKSVMINPQDTGYATFFNHPADGSSIVSVMSKSYIQNILHRMNPALGQQNGMQYSVTDPKDWEKIVKFAHDVFIKNGYKDRTPHIVEQVDQLYDYNEKESDMSKAILEIKKRYSLIGAGSMLVPPYPEKIGGISPPLPFFLPPLPGSPI